jgi:hypothetical protein
MVGTSERRGDLLALTKFDDVVTDAAQRFSEAFPGLAIVTTSVLDDASLERLKAAAWQLTGLIRVCRRWRRSVCVARGFNRPRRC